MTSCRVKYSRWALLLTGSLLLGCATAPPQEYNAWPWERTKEYGKYQTGTCVTVTGNVASFGAAPEAVKPVTLEAVQDRTPDQGAAVPVPQQETDPKQTENEVKGEYCFTIRDLRIPLLSGLELDPSTAAFDVIAFNDGNAPVSVMIDADRDASQHFSSDKPLPFHAVVPPNTNRVLFHVTPKRSTGTHSFRYTYSWSIGDYTARDVSSGYQFPFPEGIIAFASVSDNANTTPYTRNAVVFVMPAGTPVLAARKGTVVQIKADDQVDVLQEDSTIATYSHLGKIADGLRVGKALATEDVIGTVGAGFKDGGYLQLAVWRPQPRTIRDLESEGTDAGFSLVSLPLEFCSADSRACRVLKRDQTVSRSKITAAKKQGPRKTKSGKR